MKKIIGIFVSGFFIFGILGVSFGKGETLQGYFVTMDEKTVNVKNFITLRARSTYNFNYEGSLIKVPYTDIKSLTLLDENNRIVLLKKRHGKEFKIEDSMPTVDIYVFYDPINEKYSESKANVVKQIVFDEDFGELRSCPKDGKTFPPDYIFCPYDKEELKLIKVK